MLFFRVGSNLFLRGLEKIGTREFMKRTKDIDINLINYFPNNRMRSYLIKIVEFLMNNRRSFSKEVITGGGQAFIHYLLSYTDFFASGVTENVILAFAEKIGYDKLANLIMDNLLLRISTWFATDSWRERNIMTREELEQIVKGEDPAIHTAQQEADSEFEEAFGFSVEDTRAREIINLFNNIDNLTNNQKIQRFGQFNRAIIQIRNRYRSSLFNIVYILLNGTIQSSLVADITVERLRNILNQRISEPDIDTLLSRPILILKLENTFNFQYDREVFREFTYMEFIDKFLKEQFTQNGLEELLS